MSGAINPIRNPEAWDKIEIGQTESPGSCKLSGFKRANEWDLKKGKGTVGATATYVGKPPAKGTVTFYLWTEDHFNQWDAFRPLLKYDPTKKVVQAVDIWHPSLADIDVNSVIVEDIGAIEHEGKQLYSIVVTFIEYFPAPKKSAVGTPTTSAAGVGVNGAASADADLVADAKQAQIASLLDKATKP